ncbi:MAG: Amino acid permease [Candidatus Carbobacillus altaicus]|uniref:Amino acid permease n=1 Tax=Candidatus Carbonibacillus altaicus TaxID=2163959 RepID=A0A2R6Y3I4_9BACL|nr:MAG: Amino acid permease [Candidatus Carbobacillus altaicus]
MSVLFRKKSIEEARALADEKTYQLKRELTPLTLMLFVLGATIGAGIFILPGTVAALHAGPGVIVSFLLSGLITIAVGLAYVEFASMAPVAGSAYTYSYIALGEIIAWIVGWDLLFEFTVITSTVSVGWSGYVVELLKTIGIELPTAFTRDLVSGGLINVPAILGLMFVGWIAQSGIKQSGRANAVFTWTKIGAILFFIAVGVFHIQPEHYTPFTPYGWQGVLTGAALVFFAYTGFDGVTTVLEEVKRPERSIPIAMILGLGLLTTFYVIVAIVLLGMVPYTELNVPDPAAYALVQVGLNWGGALLSVAVIFGLVATMLTNGLSATRILFAMSRDGLLPEALAKVDEKRRVPLVATYLVFAAAILMGGFLSIDELAQLANIGGLSAFFLTTLSVMIMRRVRPDAPRTFRVPALPIVGTFGLIGTVALILSLPRLTFLRFAIWLVLGLVIYFAYGVRHSRLNRST